MTLREQISQLVSQLYVECNCLIEPNFPQVLVRLLPRASQTAGGLYLPEKSNKPNIEAVVLAVYKPKKIQGHEVVCDVAVGDHVLMPHYEGAPIERLDGGTGEFRLVAEEKLMSTLEYSGREASLRELTMMICDPVDTVNRLLAKYHVIPRELQPKTQSGK